MSILPQVNMMVYLEQVYTVTYNYICVHVWNQNFLIYLDVNYYGVIIMV